MTDPFPHPDSSTIESHTYDPESQHLTVTYRTGATYRYHDVPQDKVDGLRATSSANGYLLSDIKGKHVMVRL